MSSRAVRKTAGHTTKDDLAQVLQKVGINQHDEYDDESDLIASTSTNTRRNLFEMLADEEENNDEKDTRDSDDQVKTEVEQSTKSKRKRKGKKKNAATLKTDEVKIFPIELTIH